MGGQRHGVFTGPTVANGPAFPRPPPAPHVAQKALCYTLQQGGVWAKSVALTTYQFRIRVCSQSSQPDESTCDMDERQKRRGEFVVARGDASELLDATEETLDQIAIFVEMPIERARAEPIGAWRDHRLAALRRNRCDEGIRVVPLVGDDEACGLILDQRCGLVDIGDRSGREHDAHRIAQGVDGHMPFCRQPTPRTPDFLTARFFWAPEECWWARTRVESRNRCSKSASPCIAVAIRSQTPDSRQREKRTYVRCQRPNPAGKSRQGLPVRMIQSTASTNRRLFRAVQPGSPALPDRRGSMRSHRSSRNIFLSILTPFKSQDMTTFQPL